MFDLRDLPVSVLAAPMAGGPSTPSLVVAAARAGACGQLAAGYLSPQRLRDNIAAVRAEGTSLFGVNVFVPETRPTDRRAVSDYRQRLEPLAQAYRATLPALDDCGDNDDHYMEKMRLLLEEPVPIVTFTFGCPAAELVADLHEVGSSVGVTVATVDDAQTALGAGADWLCLQGPEAGGHRATFDRDEPMPTAPLSDYLREVQRHTQVPLVVAGGIARAEDAAGYRSLGAVAVQIGTVLLRTYEAGTSPAHVRALGSTEFGKTVVTRAYSGRLARGLENDFIRTIGAEAPAEFPAVNTLTGPLRRAGSEDPQLINLWAGTGFREARRESAVDTICRFG